MTSLYTRTIQTAAPFLEYHKEYVKIYENEPLIQEFNRPTKHNTNAKFKIHRDWKSFTDDVVEFVDMIEHMASCDSTPIVIFGHSLFLSAMLSNIGSNRTMVPNDISQLIFKSPNCSITTFNYSQGSWKIYNVNSVAHLPSELITGTECSFGK